jgi:uncharacterized membrane protein
MDAYLLDWINFLLRWAHVVVAIAWIGSSFYFVFLDSSLEKPTDPELLGKGVDGELWAVHGGGFYNPQKYMVAPRNLPEHLHWFFWESYSTFLTGFALFTALYLFQADTFLIDPRVHAWSVPAAIVAALAFFVVFWIAYDAVCRLFERRGGQALIAAILVVLVVVASWLACHLFAGRAAFILVGAMMAGTMSANVFFWIIPGQRKVIAQMKAGQPVDPIHGMRAKQRSVHNTYFTLPVLAAMLSNHYAFLNGAEGNWIVLVVLMAAGALIRYSFVARHKALLQNKRVPWEFAGIGVALLVAIGVWLAPARPPAGAVTATAAVPTFAEVRTIVSARCLLCHAGPNAMKNVRLDSPEGLLAHAPMVYQQAVVLKAMPMNNATQITDAERNVLKRWYEAGAHPD